MPLVCSADIEIFSVTAKRVGTHVAPLAGPSACSSKPGGLDSHHRGVTGFLLTKVLTRLACDITLLFSDTILLKWFPELQPVEFMVVASFPGRR